MLLSNERQLLRLNKERTLLVDLEVRHALTHISAFFFHLHIVVNKLRILSLLVS